LKKGEKKKREKALRRRTARKQAHRQSSLATVSRAELHHIHQARSYPIEGCWTQPDWKEHGLAVVVIARRQPNGNLVFGMYLVDYYCLGVKNAEAHAEVPPGEFLNDYLPRLFRPDPPVDISPALAHEIVYGSVEFAARYGFHPHADFRLAQYVLDPPDVHRRSGAVTFGRGGKPMYISGPHDNVDAILLQLERTAGEGNYDYLVQLVGTAPVRKGSG